MVELVDRATIMDQRLISLIVFIYHSVFTGFTIIIRAYFIFVISLLADSLIHPLTKRTCTILSSDYTFW